MLVPISIVLLTAITIGTTVSVLLETTDDGVSASHLEGRPGDR